MLSVVHNIAMMNIDRQFGIITGKKSKSTEKLSSGYKVNRAADDAAGLSVSEKMRRQIRGLQKGSENVQEGISLVQVADGALEEVTDMLQRINELSIKAYNGTNTVEDRKYIQAEIDHLLEEIDKTADRTTYNELPILKWRPTTTETVRLTQDVEVINYETIGYTALTLPDWLDKGVDDWLSVTGNYSSLNQDTSGIMITYKTDGSGNPVYGSDGKLEYVYYGKKQNDKIYFNGKEVPYSGQGWTDSLKDNATAKISFEGLKDFDTASDLYAGLTQLLGSGIGIPCGTCASYLYSVAFEGTAAGMSSYLTEKNRYYSEGKSYNSFDLSKYKAFEAKDASGNTIKNEKGETVYLNCFEKIEELMKNWDELKKAGNTVSDADKEKGVKGLADEIAKALCQKTFEIMSGDAQLKAHFSRALTLDDYSFIVYDYRDASSLTYPNATKAPVWKTMPSEVTYPFRETISGLKVNVEHPHSMWIVCSAQDADDIEINLPYVSLEKLGIKGYDVSNYKITTKYSDDYMRKLKAWEDTATVVTKETTVTYSERIPILEYVEPRYVNGEEIPGGFAFTGYKEGKTKTVPYYYNETVYAYDKPQPGEGDIITIEEYEPDDNRLIKEALERVMQWRSDLGATQNRLEHTYNNNKNKEENLTAAESRIRDTDIAEEMIQYSNLGILQQAGQAMMSHAQQDRQYILSLLQ